MPTADIGSVTLDFEERGNPADPALLLVMGLGAQRIAWPDALLDGLVARGLRVITFDNRDVGRSTILHDAPGGGALIARAMAGQPYEPPYTLEEMAGDTIGLLDHLGVDAAHVAGVSMGAMVAQHIAFGWPERVLSLVSIMSTTGEGSVGQATAEALDALFSPPPSQRAAYIEDSLAKRRILGSRTLFDEDAIRILCGMVFDRGLHPAGTARQLLAIFADGDRTERLGRITAPTLVIHGRHDPLIAVSGGEATARAIPGAQLLVLEDMCHDLPGPLVDTLVEAIGDHIAASDEGVEQVA